MGRASAVERGELVPGVKWIRVNDMIKGRFESLWPIPDGITYNSYMIRGSGGYAVVDGSDERYAGDYLDALKEALEEDGGGMGSIRYIVVNHLEPDHEATLPEMLERAPGARVVMSRAGPKIAESFYDVPRERVLAVEDGQGLELGGASLKFMFTPWLHWPETMITYYVEKGILFTTDAFGAYGSVRGGMFDDEQDFKRYEEEARRYYINIISKYNRHVAKAVERISGLDIRIIAPSHGIAYRAHVWDMLRDYASWSRPEVSGVSIAYASMYGHVPKAVEALRAKLEEAGVKARALDVTTLHESYALTELYGSEVIVFAYPTYDASVFMPVANLLYAMAVKEFGRGRRAAIVNTYGWANTVKQAEEMVIKAGFELVAPPVAIRPALRRADLEALEALASAVAWAVKKQQ